MAIKNPRKGFNFRVQFVDMPNLPIFAVQELTLPDGEIEQDEHGHGNTVIKTAGLSRITNATLTRIFPLNDTDQSTYSKFFYSWAEMAQNPVTGAGSDESMYKKTLLVHETGHEESNVVGTTVLYGCWPTKINGKEYKRAESGNLVETVELSVDYKITLK